MSLLAATSPTHLRVLIAIATIVLVAIAACSSDDGGGTAANSGELTADTAIYVANQSDEERTCLDETFTSDGEFGDLDAVLQSWADFLLDDSPTANEKLDGTAGLWICGTDEFSTLRAMSRSVFPSVPDGQAPGNLDEAKLPANRDEYLALVDRLPDTLDGAQLQQSAGQVVVYADDNGTSRFVIEAGDFSDTDYGGEWNAADGLISRLLSPYFVGSEIGTDNGLLWVRFTAPETDAEDARTIHALNWGDADAEIWFQAIAFTPEDTDLLAKTFAEAAGG
jgi:hypothetical protein